MQMRSIGKPPNFAKTAVSKAKHVGQPKFNHFKKPKIFKSNVRIPRGM